MPILVAIVVIVVTILILIAMFQMTPERALQIEMNFIGDHLHTLRIVPIHMLPIVVVTGIHIASASRCIIVITIGIVMVTIGVVMVVGSVKGRGSIGTGQHRPCEHVGEGTVDVQTSRLVDGMLWT